MYSTVTQIFEEKISNKVREDAEVVSAISAKINFDISGDGGGKWLLDCTQNPGVVSQGEVEDAKVSVSMTSEDFIKLANGELKGEMAFMMGKLKVKGDMSLAIKLGKILS